MELLSLCLISKDLHKHPLCTEHPLLPSSPSRSSFRIQRTHPFRWENVPGLGEWSLVTHCSLYSRSQYSVYFIAITFISVAFPTGWQVPRGNSFLFTPLPRPLQICSPVFSTCRLSQELVLLNFSHELPAELNQWVGHDGPSVSLHHRSPKISPRSTA